jgi:hypothetical protein
MTLGHQDPDDLVTDESARVRNECGRAHVKCHVASVEGGRQQPHRQQPYITRTPPAQMAAG